MANSKCIEARVFLQSGSFLFDIVDTDDILIVGEEVLPELIYTSPKSYAREETAERNAAKWIKTYNESTERQRRTLRGYDPASHCKLRRVKSPARKRIE